MPCALAVSGRTIRAQTTAIDHRAFMAFSKDRSTMQNINPAAAALI
jgi:hypothetical protein